MNDVRARVGDLVVLTALVALVLAWSLVHDSSATCPLALEHESDR